MIYTEPSTIGTGESMANPLHVIFDSLTSSVNVSDLDSVARAVISVFKDLPGVEAVSVAADPDRAALLDPAWNRRNKPCLGWWQGCTDPRWLTLPQHWNGLIENIPAAGIAVGIGQIPGGQPWPELEKGGPETKGWILAPIRNGDKVMLAVLVGMSRNPSLDPVTLSALRDLQTFMNPLVGAWSEIVALKWKLNQAENNSRALTRLNRLQGRFVSMASHELKTPLTSITAYSDSLHDQINDKKQPIASEFIGVIRSEAGRLLRMVNRILDFSRMEYGLRLDDCRPRDLEPLVRDTVRSLKPASMEKNHEVKVSAGLSLPRTEIDADLIRQVLVNLVGNAIKYTPPQGEINITLHETASAVEVRVSDNGPGVPVSEQRRIFGEFIRSQGTAGSEEGTGLGLSIARHIVHLHGGTIGAASGQDGGSVFSFAVPKEILLPVEIDKTWTHATGKTETQDLMRILVRLLAEYTGSQSVTLYLKNDLGVLNPVMVLGHQLPNEEPSAWLIDKKLGRFLSEGRCCILEDSPKANVPWQPELCRNNGQAMMAAIGSGDDNIGCIVLGRPMQAKGYENTHEVQLNVLADVSWTALIRLAGFQKNEMGERFAPRKITEALGVLLETHRVGITTGTAEAIDILGRLATGMGLDSHRMERLMYAAVIHDAGMAKVEEDIIWGATELSFDERDEVDRHVDLGVDLMAPLMPDLELAGIIRHHHEWFDGTGHPGHLKGSSIPVESRLLAITDAWFSLTRTRPFRPGKSPVKALQEIKNNAGSQFSHECVAGLEIVLQEMGLLADSLNPTG
jgi:signal transduction histidine kinase